MIHLLCHSAQADAKRFKPSLLVCWKNEKEGRQACRIVFRSRSLRHHVHFLVMSVILVSFPDSFIICHANLGFRVRPFRSSELCLCVVASFISVFVPTPTPQIEQLSALNCLGWLRVMIRHVILCRRRDRIRLYCCCE